jgi:hypothetical protein
MAKGRKVELPQGTPLREHFNASKIRVTRLLEETARGIAGAFWEDEYRQVEYRVRSDIFRKRYPNQYAYIDECWPHWIKDARAVLAHMLNDRLRPEDQKKEIYEALTGGFETVTQFLPPPHVLYGPNPGRYMN